MRPKQRRKARYDDPFRARLERIINMKHELVILADRIDWAWLDEELAAYFSDEQVWERRVSKAQISTARPPARRRTEATVRRSFF